MADDGGKAAFKAFMAALPAEITADIQPALDKSADEMVSAMKAIVAVSEEDGGHLRDTIHSETGDHKLSRKIIAGGEGAENATYLEFGTADMPAQPFFWLVIRSLRRRANSRINRAINAAVKRYHA